MKRLLIYVFYDPDGVDSGYRYFFLNQVRSLFQRIIISVSGTIEGETWAKFEGLGAEICCHENHGFDAGAYQYIFQNVLKYRYADFDEIILSNDSFYGPVGDYLEKIFSEAEADSNDFWGLSSYENSKGLSYVSHAHIQSYFLGFKKRVFSSTAFRQFWEELPLSDDYHNTIRDFESSLSYYLKERGLISWSYLDQKGFHEPGVNLYMEYPYTILAAYGFPFLKRKAILPENTSGFEQGLKAIGYMWAKGYPTQLIDSDITEGCRRGYLRSRYNYLEINRFLNGHTKIYIYGAGSVGHRLGAYLTFKDCPDWQYLLSDGEPNDCGAMFFSAYSYQDGDGVIIGVGKAATGRLKQKALQKVPEGHLLAFPE